MKLKKRQKLCHHCEGEVDLDVIVCPFCAADLREERPARLTTAIEQLPQIEDPVATVASEEKPRPVFVPLFALAAGLHLFILGLLLFLLSDRGVLLLKFNAAWWPFHLIGSIPLLIFGYRSLKD